jgi:hypothetical protein
MCRRIAPQQVAQVEAEVSRFQKTYPELMALIDKSSFLDAAKRQNAQTVEGMAESVAKNPDLARCDDVIAMLRQWVDHPEANSGIAEMIDELKK